MNAKLTITFSKTEIESILAAHVRSNGMSPKGKVTFTIKQRSEGDQRDPYTVSELESAAIDAEIVKSPGMSNISQRDSSPVNDR